MAAPLPPDALTMQWESYFAKATFQSAGSVLAKRIGLSVRRGLESPRYGRQECLRYGVPTRPFSFAH